MIWYWVSFLLLVFFLLALDLGVLNRKNHVIGYKEALGWTAFWVFLAMCFNVFVYFAYENHWSGIGRDFGHSLDGSQAALEFLAAYVVEKSLSLDNIFVFAVIFSYFAVPAIYQHRLLFWGILGALIMRGLMIGVGTALINNFVWIHYVFGAILIFTAYKMATSNEESLDPEKNPLVRFARRYLPISPTFHEDRFTVRIDGKLMFTPMFLVLLVIESTDVLFAIDSIPAVFAITKDPFLVFTSNIFAILGLRALYFALAGVMREFHYIKHSLVVLLAYVGGKMLISHYYKPPILASLGIIFLVLTIGVVASILKKKESQPESAA
jgi:tellurite resistance protein TerC